MRRRALLAAAGLTSLAAACAPPSRSERPAAGAARSSPSPSPRPIAIGAYVAFVGMSDARARAQRAAELGRGDRIVSLYFAWTDRFPTAFGNVPDGSVLLLSWRGTAYADILDGSADDRITANADALRRYGKPVYLRFAWEMNGAWFDWGGPNNASGADGYIKAWRHVHDVFAAAGARNVIWVWCVNWNNNPDTPANAAARYYPGDAYVDWIAVDGFSDAGEAPEYLFGAFYRTYAGRKPLMIAETAVTKPAHGDRSADLQAAWIGTLAMWLKAHPDIRALVWFDTDLPKANGVQTDWRVDAFPGELSAYRGLVQDPYFQGKL